MKSAFAQSAFCQSQKSSREQTNFLSPLFEPERRESRLRAYEGGGRREPRTRHVGRVGPSIRLIDARLPAIPCPTDRTSNPSARIAVVMRNALMSESCLARSQVSNRAHRVSTMEEVFEIIRSRKYQPEMFFFKYMHPHFQSEYSSIFPHTTTKIARQHAYAIAIVVP